MTKAITFSKVELNSIEINKISGGYICQLNYSIQNADGSVSYPMESIKGTLGTDMADKLSVGSDALVINFTTAMTTLATQKEDL
jgi:hypothetical protein